MSISLVGEASTLNYSVRTNMVFTKPANTVENDILLCTLCINNTTAPTPPAGWVQIGSTVNTGGVYWYSYWLRAGGSEGASYTWTRATSNSCSGIMKRFSGCITTGDPWEGTPYTGYGPTNAAFVTGSITSTSASAAYVQMTAGNNISTLTSTSLTERNYSNGQYCCADLQVSPGASGAKTLDYQFFVMVGGLGIFLTPAGEAGGSSAPIVNSQYRRRWAA
jgi:hypothetical protein